jgi:hypothetical protein
VMCTRCIYGRHILSIVSSKAAIPMHVLWQFQCMFCGNSNACFEAIPMHVLWQFQCMFWVISVKQQSDLMFV